MSPYCSRAERRNGFQKYEYPVGIAPVIRMAAADFNGDGKLDLAVADNESAKVFVLMNTTR